MFSAKLYRLIALTTANFQNVFCPHFSDRRCLGRLFLPGMVLGDNSWGFFRLRRRFAAGAFFHRALKQGIGKMTASDGLKPEYRPTHR
uniref:Uncharacterized protein n=1 Tax=Dechloromonas aromatica (strain RCB) TaxID=159087 RepID=Q47ES5_DECAR